VVVASPAAALLLLVAAIIAATTEALVVRTVRAVSMLASTGIAAHAICVAAMKTVALEVARVAAIAANVLGWRETALSSRSIGS
jgi:hypothetical protein